MKNLIKAQLYQISKTRVFMWVFVFFTALSALFGAVEFLNGADWLEEGQLLTASDFATRMGITPVFAIMGMAFFTGLICADDFSDKTCNYEVMSGRMRGQIYLARGLVSIAVSVAFGLFTMTVSLVTSALLTGWGDSITVGTAITRIALMAFPYLRLSCLFVLLAYILKKPVLVLVVTYLMIGALNILTANAPDQESVLTAMSNIAMLLHYDTWLTFGIDSGTNYMYESSLAAEKIVQTIAASLGAGALYLGIGYSYFHGDDLE